MINVVRIVHWIFQLFTLIVIIDIVLSYFMSPFQPVRQFFDRLVQPLLAPIRKILPQTSTLDFSPFVLIILLWLLESLITNILLRL